jgi:CO/xanthine dehydrogenase FAD-binding subunit
MTSDDALPAPLATLLAERTWARGVARALVGVVTGLGSRPRALTGWSELAEGRPLDDVLLDELAERAHKQCHPLENIIVDPEWRRAMVPVFVRRALDRMRTS